MIDNRGFRHRLRNVTATLTLALGGFLAPLSITKGNRVQGGNTTLVSLWAVTGALAVVWVLSTDFVYSRIAAVGRAAGPFLPTFNPPARSLPNPFTKIRLKLRRTGFPDWHERGDLSESQRHHVSQLHAQWNETAEWLEKVKKGYRDPYARPTLTKDALSSRLADLSREANQALDDWESTQERQKEKRSEELAQSAAVTRDDSHTPPNWGFDFVDQLNMTTAIQADTEADARQKAVLVIYQYIERHEQRDQFHRWPDVEP